MNLLPEWLFWIWVAAFVYIAASHLRHVIRMHGRRRAWHIGHTTIAAGMIDMFLQHVGLQLLPTLLWEAIFGAYTMALVAWMLWMWGSGRSVNLLWLVFAADMAAMVYMFALPRVAIAPLTYALVVYFGLLAVAWMSGLLDDEKRSRKLLPFAIGPKASGKRSADALFEHTTIEHRVTLAGMALGMAYMFVAMHDMFVAMQI